MVLQTRFTPSGVRLRLTGQRAGSWDWLLFPGGPGLGSESVQGLADCAALPGRTWLVDLPGDGSNLRDAPGDEAFSGWPTVLLEAFEGMAQPVAIGHSTGGMYLLSVPELASRLKGLVLIGCAEDARWQDDFATMAQQHPLPEADLAQRNFAGQPGDANLRALLVATASWSFTPEGLDEGRRLFAGLPCNLAAMNWSASQFDPAYQARWWPESMPVLLLAGEHDRIVGAHRFQAQRYRGRNVHRERIAGAGHYPWVEHPEQVRQALQRFSARLGQDGRLRMTAHQVGSHGD